MTLREKMNITAAEFDYGVDEFAAAVLRRLPRCC
jgi:hypothetical protein